MHFFISLTYSALCPSNIQGVFVIVSLSTVTVTGYPGGYRISMRESCRSWGNDKRNFQYIGTKNKLSLKSCWVSREHAQCHRMFSLQAFFWPFAHKSCKYAPRSFAVSVRMVELVRCCANFHDTGGVLKGNMWTRFSFVENGSAASGPRFSVACVFEASGNPCQQGCCNPFCHRNED